MKGYKSETQQKNIAWFLPRPKPDRYKGGMPLYAEEWLLDLAKDILKRSDIDILNLFCGMNQKGFRIDINPKVNPTHVADAHTFAENWNDSLFDVILADPPYSDEENKELYQESFFRRLPKLNYKKWTDQCDKVLRKGGLLIVYHKYVMPNPNPEKYEVVKRVFIGTRTYHLPRVAIFFRKKLSVGASTQNPSDFGATPSFNKGVEGRSGKPHSPKLSPTEITSPNPNIMPNFKIALKSGEKLR